MKRFVLLLLASYQRVLSPDTGLIRHIIPFPKTCRFTPTCSRYTYQAVDSYGIIVGLWMGAKRIMRCHPWNKGGYDPVPTRL